MKFCIEAKHFRMRQRMHVEATTDLVLHSVQVCWGQSIPVCMEEAPQDDGCIVEALVEVYRSLLLGYSFHTVFEGLQCHTP